VADNGDEY